MNIFVLCLPLTTELYEILTNLCEKENPNFRMKNEVSKQIDIDSRHIVA